MKDDEFFEQIGKQGQDWRAPAKLKSRLYTSLIRKQQEEGPLEPVSATKAAGGRLCVFEELVRIAPAGAPLESVFHCNVCHARVLAEHLENPPIWWPHCPYVQFKKT